MKPMPILLVALGGASGAVARYLVGLLVTSAVGARWPLGTFVVNISGCFFIGLCVPLLARLSPGGDPLRYLLPIGFVGAYTTFSTYALETVELLGQRAWWRAGSYVVLSVVAGGLAVALGIAVARRA
jgi:fluoride exporter